MHKFRNSALFAAIASVMLPVYAEQESDETIEKVVVTAELIDRPLSESAYSTQVFDQKKLQQQAGLDSLRDVLAATANINVVTGTGKGPSVRGIDGTGAAENAIAFFAGSRARMSWQLDNRPANYNEIIFSDLGIYDLSKIELLRGAQSTLVGRNAMAGTMVVKTQDPVFDFDANAQLSFGNYQQQRTAGMLNIPLIDDKLAVRVVADWYSGESAVDYQSFDGMNNPGDVKAKSLRSKILYYPSDDMRWLITLNHNEYQSPNSEIITRPFDDRVSNVPQQPVHQPITSSISSDFTWDMSSNLQFSLLASMSDFEFTRYARPNSSNATIDSSEYMLEPRISFKTASGFSGVSGLYYYQADQEEFIEFAGGTEFDDETRTFAIYSEGVQPLTDTLDLSFGLRYERESRTRYGSDVSDLFVQVDSDETYDVLLPKLAINWKVDSATHYGAQISRGYNAGGSGVAFVIPLENFDYDKETVWTYEVYGRHSIDQLSINYNLFYADYTDMQLPFDLTPNDSRDEAFVVRNADQVITYGGEFGLDYQLSEQWGLFLNLGLLNTDISQYPNSGVAGNELLTAPNTTANTGINWQQQNLSASMVVRYSDGYFTDVNNRPRGKTDGYTVVDAKLGYDFGQIELFASINNLFDSEKPIAYYPALESANDTAVLLQPRKINLSIRWSYQ